MLSNVLVRGFYVTEDTRTAPIVSALTSVFYILTAYVLVRIGGYVGLAVTALVSGLIGATVLSILLVRRLQVFHIQRLLKESVTYAIASVIAGLSAYLVSGALVDFPALVRLMSAGIVGGGSYLIILSRVDPEILNSILEMVGVGRVFHYLRLGSFGKARPTD